MPLASANPLAALKPTIISAPFGNYIQPVNATATLGTFTRDARPGRVRQIIKTVRYYRRLRAWVNCIGLRNPGMGWLIDRAQTGKINVTDKIVSIHGFDAEQWQTLFEQIAAIKPAAVELNMSCPNVGQIDWPQSLFTSAMQMAVPVIVKLPPVNYELIVDQARAAGVRAFHCCNTLPVPAGGLSGAPLKPLSLACIRALRARSDANDVILIGGGGIRTRSDIDDYVTAGANHFALGTITMNPILLLSHRRLTPLITHANAHQPSVG